MAVISDNMRGAALMMGSMAAFTFNDTCMKALSGTVPLAQAVFLRGALVSVLIYLLARHQGALKLRLTRRDRGLIALRTGAEIAATFFFLTALFHMPIGNVTAVLQALPLTVAFAAALFLREPLGWRRIFAIAVGFCGVMLIVRPGPEGFDIHALYALAAVFCVTLRDLTARQLSRAVPSLTVALTAAIAITAFFGLKSLAEPWAPVDLHMAGLLAGASFFIFGGYLFSVMTMRVGEIGFIAPFRYTGLIWALLMGLVFFGEWPDPLTLLGAMIVVAMGAFTLYRERQVARRSVPGLRLR